MKITSISKFLPFQNYIRNARFMIRKGFRISKAGPRNFISLSLSYHRKSSDSVIIIHLENEIENPSESLKLNVKRNSESRNSNQEELSE